ncbi:MAG: hypothetical protein HY296_05550 [Thaumarchaeota archaeon]|nr:hypothetical protein [Nitrososphaerota archaeon]
MSKAIEETVKALTDFESQLDAAMSEATDAKKRMLKDAVEWAASAKAAAVDKAHAMARETLESARGEAEKEASEIRKKGQSGLKKYEDSMSRHKGDAVELVEKRLLGEPS